MKPTSDTWVGSKIIQNCHVRYGAGVLCLVYVVPGLVVMLYAIMNPDEDDSCMKMFITGLVLFVFFVPMSVILLFINLIKLNNKWLEQAKM